VPGLSVSGDGGGCNERTGRYVATAADDPVEKRLCKLADWRNDEAREAADCVLQRDCLPR
jgi:hypothetical protein